MPYADPEKQRQYQREVRARRRADWLAANGPCVRCGSWDQLEVDHVDRTQKVSHNIWSWTEARRVAELAKCQVLCRPCHVEKSHEVGDIAPKALHGSRTMYRRGCRCAECQAWNTRVTQRKRARRKSER